MQEVGLIFLTNMHNHLFKIFTEKLIKYELTLFFVCKLFTLKNEKQKPELWCKDKLK